LSRLTRRKFLVQAAAVGALPLLAACAQPAAAPTTAPKATEAPKPAATAAPAASAAPAGAYQPPAAIKGFTLNILEASYFIAAAQDLFKKQAGDFAKLAGGTVNTDFITWTDLQAKIAAAIQAGGYDIVELWPGWNFLYWQNMVEVTDIAQAVEKAGGGWEDYVINSAPVNGKYYGVPHGQSNNSINYRISYWKQAGVANAEDGMKIDMTWEEYWKVGAFCKKTLSKPIGCALGHSTGDPPSFAYPFMWSYGAMEVEKDGKTVSFNKPAFVDGVKLLLQAWKDSYDETGLAWDDNGNNKAFLADQLSATANGSSIYTTAKGQNPNIAADMSHCLIPKGPSGRFYNLGSRTMAILKNSKQQEPAKEFLKWWFQDSIFGDWFHLQEGYMLQNTKKWAADPMWTKDPKMTAFKEQPKYGRDYGYAGPNNDKAGLAFSKYVIVDTLAKAIQSGDAAGSIKWGADELQKIYGA
jgi:multiple sugar transport system substrate-binding protein